MRVRDRRHRIRGNRASRRSRASRKSRVGKSLDVPRKIQPCGSKLLALPPELRNIIWSFTVVTPEPVSVPCALPALTQVIRQIRSECRPMFFGLNTFHVRHSQVGEADRVLSDQSILLQDWRASFPKSTCARPGRFCTDGLLDWAFAVGSEARSTMAWNICSSPTDPGEHFQTEYVTYDKVVWPFDARRARIETVSLRTRSQQEGRVLIQFLEEPESSCNGGVRRLKEVRAEKRDFIRHLEALSREVELKSFVRSCFGWHWLRNGQDFATEGNAALAARLVAWLDLLVPHVVMVTAVVVTMCFPVHVALGLGVTLYSLVVGVVMTGWQP